MNSWNKIFLIQIIQTKLYVTLTPQEKLIYMAGYLAGTSSQEAWTCPYDQDQFAVMVIWMQGFYAARIEWGWND